MMFFLSGRGSEIVCMAFYEPMPVKQSFNVTHDCFQNKFARLIQILVQNTIINQKYMYNLPTVGIRQYNLITFLWKVSTMIKRSDNTT